MNRQTLAGIIAGAVVLAVIIFGAIAFSGSGDGTMTMPDGSTMPADEMDEGMGADDEGSTNPSSVPFDRAFIDAMVPHHRSAIEMVQEAKRAGLSNPEVVQIANDIVSVQQQEIAQMLDWREAWFGSREIDPAGAAELGLSDEMMGMEHEMGSIETAAVVDVAFSEAMISHHEGAIEMAKLALDRGQHAEVIRLAEEIIAAQEREIAILQPHAEGHGGS